MHIAKTMYTQRFTLWSVIRAGGGGVLYYNSCTKDSGYTNILLDILIYFRIRHSFAHLRPMILSVDWSISRLQSWTCSSLPAVAEFVKLTQSIVIEMQWQSADLYKVQLCNRQFFVVSTTIYVVKVYECHPLGCTLKVVAESTVMESNASFPFCVNFV